MLTFAYSGEPLPTHCSTKFTTVLRGPDGVGVLRHDSMEIFASSPPGGMTPHSARKVQKMPASGISSELSAHQIAPSGVVAHSRPPLSPRASIISSSSFVSPLRPLGLGLLGQPTCRSRRALEPIRAESTVVPLLSSGTQSSSTHRLWMRWARNQCFVMDVQNRSSTP